MLLGISGKRGSGKSLLASFLVKLGWREVSFAAELKKRVRQDFDLTAVETDGALKESPTQYIRRGYGGLGTEVELPWTPRGIMIAYGQFFRSVDPDFWVKQAFKQIGKIPDDVPVVIADVRFKNEAGYIKDHGGMLIRLERDKKLNIYKNEINDSSETELDKYRHFDMVIGPNDNRVSEDLAFLAKRLQILREQHAIHQTT